MDLKIIVCCHKDIIDVRDNIYHPIHVGKANSGLSLGIPGDDTGDNISEKNNLYCELTGLYWAWKNIDADFIGLCHYRRFFSFHTKRKSYLFFRMIVQKLKQFLYVFSPKPKDTYFYYSRYAESNPQRLKKAIVEFENEIVNYLDNNPNTIAFALKDVNFGMTPNRIVFSKLAGNYHLDVLGEIIKKDHPQLYPFYQSTLESNRLHYANMTIMKKSIMDKYCTFLFDVLEKHLVIIKDRGYIISENEKSICRLSGYLGELLTSTFINFLSCSGEGRVELLSQIQYES